MENEYVLRWAKLGLFPGKSDPRRLVDSKLLVSDFFEAVQDRELCLLLAREETSESGEVESEFSIPATLRWLFPINFWRARTVARCSSGYSSMRKRILECATRYISN